MDRTNKRWMACLVATVIGISVLSACGSADRDSSGEVIEEGSVSVWEIRVGDCLTDTFESDSNEFSSANAIPCDQPHAFEAYHRDYFSGDTFPTDVGSAADDICYYAFVDYFGMPVEETNLTFYFLFPTKESWESRSDREITCITGMDDGSYLTGKLRN